MNAENFCYWLQGWLEIERPVTVSFSKLEEIKNHIELALTEPNQSRKIYQDNSSPEHFLEWLDTFLDSLPASMNGLDEEQTEKIDTNLQKVFVKVTPSFVLSGSNIPISSSWGSTGIIPFTSITC